MTHAFPKGYGRDTLLSFKEVRKPETEFLFDTRMDNTQEELILLLVVGSKKGTSKENETVCGLVLQQDAGVEDDYFRLGF